LAVHGLAVLSLLLLALQSTNEPLPPPFAARLTLQLAPPPPSPLVRGTTPERVRSAERALTPEPSRTLATPVAFPAIPETFLLSAPAIDLSHGFEGGYDDGGLDGMPSGLPGGILGGVPGGVVGGAVGGTGRALPQFPRPDVGPRPIEMPQPGYTEEAIRNNVTGSVVLRVVIDERGTVSVLEVLRSVPELDAEAIRVVESQWRFQPATRAGRPVATLSELRVRFQLH
jgi:protein TonB